MEWQVEWGPFQNKKQVRLNHPPPHVPFYCQHYLSAFSLLQGDRINSLNGIGYIPMAAKAVYAETFRVPDPRVFVRILTAMDIAYVDKVRAMNDRKELKK